LGKMHSRVMEEANEFAPDSTPVESHQNDCRNFRGNVFIFEDLLDRLLIHIMLPEPFLG
jgi:hypothetical protein